MFSQASLNSGKMVLMDHGTLIDHNYGQWFIRWYAGVLNTHTGDVLKLARNVFSSIKLSTKIAGIHWWYMYSCHCAETTAGFNNFIFYDGYRDLISQFQKYQIDVCFTCLEMTADSGNGSNPPYLVQQILSDTAFCPIFFNNYRVFQLVVETLNTKYLKNPISKIVLAMVILCS